MRSTLSSPDPPAIGLFRFPKPPPRRRSFVTAWGGWPRVFRLLAVLFFFALSYDLGAFSALPWESAAMAAEPSTDGQPATPATLDKEEHGHQNPVTPVLLAIVIILLLAKTGGDLFERLGLPAVLGELVVGILLGNFALLTGITVLEPLFHLPEVGSVDPSPAAILKILAGIGVVLLLFEVGLESTVHEMLSVGTSSLLVALLGVIAPMGLGWLVGWLVVPELGPEVHAFLGATLCATSVGITARVLKDLGRGKQRESQIILGAAVIDDVLGLVILSVVSGVIISGAFDPATMGLVILKATAFLFGAILLGSVLLTRPLFKVATRLNGHGLLVSVALVICFGFAYLATLVGLEPIVGAFAAGLILERAHYRELGEKENHHELEVAIAPLSALLVPIFFVQMGTQVDLASFAKPSVWTLAGSLTFVAILGKQVCALGVLEKGLNRLAVGLGMIPRGEVGLIFAAVGASLIVNGQPVINADTYSAVVVMVMLTTMVTPPLLKWSLTRSSGSSDVQPPSPSEEPKPAC